MAQSLQTLRDSGVTSIHGRRLTLDSQDYLVGSRGIRDVVEDLTTSTGVTIVSHGAARVITTGSTQGPVQYRLPTPVPGTRKVLAITSTSTGSHQFLSTPNNANILSASDGTPKVVVNLRQPGAFVILEALTTALWAVSGSGAYNSTALGQSITFTTSTA